MTSTVNSGLLFDNSGVVKIFLYAASVFRLDEFDVTQNVKFVSVFYVKSNWRHRFGFYTFYTILWTAKQEVGQAVSQERFLLY